MRTVHTWNTMSLFLILLLVKPIQDPFNFHCSCYFYRSNRLKTPFIFCLLGIFTVKTNSTSVSFSLFLVLLQIKSIKIPYHFHSSWHFYTYNRLKPPYIFSVSVFLLVKLVQILNSLFLLLILLVIKTIQISFHCLYS